jgi:hypothetical protein
MSESGAARGRSERRPQPDKRRVHLTWGRPCCPIRRSRRGRWRLRRSRSAPRGGACTRQDFRIRLVTAWSQPLQRSDRKGLRPDLVGIDREGDFRRDDTPRPRRRSGTPTAWWPTTRSRSVRWRAIASVWQRATHFRSSPISGDWDRKHQARKVLASGHPTEPVSDTLSATVEYAFSRGRALLGSRPFSLEAKNPGRAISRGYNTTRGRTLPGAARPQTGAAPFDDTVSRCENRPKPVSGDGDRRHQHSDILHATPQQVLRTIGRIEQN